MRQATRCALPPGSPLPPAAQTFAIWKSPFAYLERCRRRYGSCFTTNMTSHPPLVFLSDLNDIKTMLTAPAEVLHPGEGGATIMPIVGEDSFMLLDEEEHLNGRKLVLPSFHVKAVRDHAELVAEVARREVACWPRDVPFALHPRLRALTLEVILRTIFGPVGSLGDDRLYALRDRLLGMLAVTASGVLPEPLLRHGPGRRIWTRFLRERAAVDELIYGHHRGSSCASRGRSGELFDRLLRAHNPDGSAMSPRQVRDNLMSIVLAGHETTASELAWAFQLLAHNPRVLERLIEEIDRDAGERVPDRDGSGGAASPARVPVFNSPGGQAADRNRWLDLSPADAAAGVHLSRAPRRRALSRAARVPSRALPGALRRARIRGCRGAEDASAAPACTWRRSR